MYVWDEKKRKANLLKHGLDFADAYVVYENTSKVTLQSARKTEERRLDVAFVEVAEAVLVLIYVERGDEVRVISFRRASRTERRLYASAKEQD